MHQHVFAILDEDLTWFTPANRHRYRPRGLMFVCALIGDRVPRCNWRYTQVRRGSLTPRLAFFTRLHIPAGCELTYDYGAAGAAGGRTEERASHEDDDTLQQHVCKAPRLSSVKKGHKSTFTESRSEVLLLVSNDMSSSSLRSAEVDEERISSRRPEAWKSDDDAKGSLSSSRVPVRRPCLCGARRCRGLLPCNRAIL